jgi:hypothetical protein
LAYDDPSALTSEAKEVKAHTNIRKVAGAALTSSSAESPLCWAQIFRDQFHAEEPSNFVLNAQTAEQIFGLIRSSV